MTLEWTGCVDGVVAEVWVLPHPFGSTQAGAPTKLVRRGAGWVVAVAGSSLGLVNEGWWIVPGEPPRSVAWTSDEHVVQCRFLGGEPPDTTVTGRVHDPFGRPGSAEVVGCGGWGVADQEGTFVLRVRTGPQCALWARAAGKQMWGGLTWVTPGTDLDNVVVSTTPPEVARLVAAVNVDVDSVVVVALTSRASLLRVGDRLWSIDGRPLGDKPLAVLEAALGRAGQHRVEVERDGERRELLLCPSTDATPGGCGLEPSAPAFP